MGSSLRNPSLQHPRGLRERSPSSLSPLWRTRRRPVVVSDRFGSESIAIHSVGHLAMSWDHRAIDGSYAAGFLRQVKQIIESRDWSTEL